MLKDGEKEIIDNVSKISCLHAPKQLDYYQCNIFSPDRKESVHSEKITDVTLFSMKDAFIDLEGNIDTIRSVFTVEFDLAKKVRCVLRNDYDRGTDRLDCFIRM